MKTWLPGVIIGTLSLVSGACIFFLPETQGRGLPTSAAQINAYSLNLDKATKEALRKERRKRNKFLFWLKKDLGDKGSDNPQLKINSSEQLNGHYVYPGDILPTWETESTHL